MPLSRRFIELTKKEARFLDNFAKVPSCAENIPNHRLLGVDLLRSFTLCGHAAEVHLGPAHLRELDRSGPRSALRSILCGCRRLCLHREVAPQVAHPSALEFSHPFWSFPF